MISNSMHGELNRRLSVLDRIYDIYEEFIASYDLACQHGCAACCTCNMTLTTLEGYRILADMDGATRKSLFEKVREVSGNKRFQPQMTINTIARLCKDGDPVPGETIDPSWGACPLLFDDACPIYTLRPFGCRCMVSGRDCRKTGYAQVDDYILTVNNLFLQHIEHIDARGGTSSLIDILLYLGQPEQLETYHKKMAIIETSGLAPNRLIPVLMVPPEHRHQLQPILQKLQQLGQA
jgi:hypothetical protein